MATEPISSLPPRPVRAVTMRQDWTDVVFLHWEVEPAQAQRFLPPGVRVDQYEGRTFVGLIGLGIRVALLGAVPVPCAGRFPEINVRLYSVDGEGRRGIVFRSLDAGRLLPTVAARGAYRLPYCWWSGRGERRGDVVRYAGRRLWPGGGPATRFAVRVGAPLGQPSAFEHFLTARWALHWSWGGRTLRATAEHPPWRLHHADLVESADELVAAAGLPVTGHRPVSVLYAPGVSARIGPPHPPRRG